VLHSTSARVKMLGGVALAAGLAVSAMAAPAVGAPARTHTPHAVKAVHPVTVSHAAVKARTARPARSAHAPAASAAQIRMAHNLRRLRICESGNNFRENSGNGYYGAYQFAPSTWHAIGFRGRPDHAKHLTQNRAAMKLHHMQGWSAWPSCARAEHLA
jgi:resuscitation-promoting factor RpfA